MSDSLPPLTSSHVPLPRLSNPHLRVPLRRKRRLSVTLLSLSPSLAASLTQQQQQQQQQHQHHVRSHSRSHIHTRPHRPPSIFEEPGVEEPAHEKASHTTHTHTHTHIHTHTYPARRTSLTNIGASSSWDYRGSDAKAPENVPAADSTIQFDEEIIEKLEGLSVFMSQEQLSRMRSLLLVYSLGFHETIKELRALSSPASAHKHQGREKSKEKSKKKSTHTHTHTHTRKQTSSPTHSDHKHTVTTSSSSEQKHSQKKSLESVIDKYNINIKTVNDDNDNDDNDALGDSINTGILLLLYANFLT